MGLDTLHRVVDAASYWQIGLVIALAFAGLYLGYAGLALYLTRSVLPRRGIGRPIETGPLAAHQVRDEIGHSLVSIVIFAAYGAVTVAAERHHVVRIDWDPGSLAIGLNLIGLTLWNEIHFYACHRLLHTRWLYRKVHRVHHRSRVPTPFSTYAFHWFEATLLSSVMISALLIWPLDIVTLVIFPGISLIANSIGHMNYAVFPDKRPSALLAACQRHTAHHTRWNGNYGFYLPWLDRWLGTDLPAKSYRLG